MHYNFNFNVKPLNSKVSKIVQWLYKFISLIFPQKNGNTNTKLSLVGLTKNGMSKSGFFVQILNLNILILILL